MINNNNNNNSNDKGICSGISTKWLFIHYYMYLSNFDVGAILAGFAYHMNQIDIETFLNLHNWIEIIIDSFYYSPVK